MEGKRRVQIQIQDLSGFVDLRLKWQLVLAVRGGQIDLAKKIWNELQGLLPSSFGEFLQIKDPLEKNSAFGRCLSFLMPKWLPQQIVLNSISDWLESGVPLRKEELIELHWGVDYSPKYDNRFYKFVERLKKKRPDLQIQQNHYAYLAFKS